MAWTSWTRWRGAGSTTRLNRTTAESNARFGPCCVRPMLRFKQFATARRTLAGIEVMAMLSKGQVRAVPADTIPPQGAFVPQFSALPPDQERAVQGAPFPRQCNKSFKDEPATSLLASVGVGPAGDLGHN